MDYFLGKLYYDLFWFMIAIIAMGTVYGGFWLAGAFCAWRASRDAKKHAQRHTLF